MNTCQQLAIDLSGLQVTQINDMVFIMDNRSLVRHLNYLLTESFDAFIDVSPDLTSPQLLNQEQIADNKCVIKSLLNRIDSNRDDQYMRIDMMADMCLITGCLLGYPIIYTNREPQSGNCLAFEPLSHFSVKMNERTIYSFSCPQIYRIQFEKHINLWFEALDRQTFDGSLSLNETIKTLSFVLT